MALSLTHQIGSLAGTSMPDTLVAGESSSSLAMLSAAAVWKFLSMNIRCVARKPDLTTADALSPLLTLCKLPSLTGIRPDLSVACKAFATDTAANTLKTEEAQRAY